MKADIHPYYRTVVFHDITIEVSSKSHPYYTGKQKTFSTEGSAARFRQRFGGFINAKRG